MTTSALKPLFAGSREEGEELSTATPGAKSQHKVSHDTPRVRECQTHMRPSLNLPALLLNQRANTHTHLPHSTTKGVLSTRSERVLQVTAVGRLFNLERFPGTPSRQLAPTKEILSHSEPRLQRTCHGVCAARWVVPTASPAAVGSRSKWKRYNARGVWGERSRLTPSQRISNCRNCVCLSIVVQGGIAQGVSTTREKRGEGGGRTVGRGRDEWTLGKARLAAICLSANARSRQGQRHLTQAPAIVTIRRILPSRLAVHIAKRQREGHFRRWLVVNSW